MARGIGTGQTLRTSNTLRIDPKVILASQILELNQAELEQALEIELNENPALERLDDSDNVLTHEDILRSVAPRELKPNGECNELYRSLPHDINETDWVDLAASNDSLWDHLRGQLMPQTPQPLRQLLEYVIGSVNDRGYLTCVPEEAAMDCNCLLEDAAWMIDRLKDCEPAGVGASDLRECLMLQLRNAESDAERLARAMLKSDWENLVQRDARAIKRHFKVPCELVEEAFEVIVSLNPFPGEGFAASAVSAKTKASIAQPDIVLKRDDRGWSVDVMGPSPLNLRIDRGYAKRLQELDAMSVAPKDEKRHVYEFVDRAKRFLEAVTGRRKLLAEIGKYLIERQQGFVSTGEYRFLNPLTRSQLSIDLGAHESTVSRATNGKFVQIATGEIVSFEVFFKPALRVQKLIEEILSSENPDSPLSDEAITRILEQQGVKVARRTVNKYRDRTKLLSSRRRRSA